MTVPLRLILLLFCLFRPPGYAEIVPNAVFGPGEKFVFEVNYGFLSGGFARMEVLDTARVNGVLCHTIRALAHSNKVLSVVFPVRDTNTSYMSVNGLYSMKIVKNIHEGSYKRFRTTAFDHDNGLARTNDSTVKCRPFVQDVVSAFYFFRLLHGVDAADLDCFDDYKNYPLRVRVTKREKIKTPIGSFKCLRVEPELASSGIFLKKGKMTVWLTDDARRLPVQVQFKLPYLGNISCDLVEYSAGSIMAQDTLPPSPASPPAAPAPDSSASDSIPLP